MSGLGPCIYCGGPDGFMPSPTHQPACPRHKPGKKARRPRKRAGQERCPGGGWMHGLCRKRAGHRGECGE